MFPRANGDVAKNIILNVGKTTDIKKQLEVLFEARASLAEDRNSNELLKIIEGLLLEVYRKLHMLKPVQEKVQQPVMIYMPQPFGLNQSMFQSSPCCP